MSLILFFELVWMFNFFFFFFQAEDGIRDLYVTGVQTCVLPIYREKKFRQAAFQYLFQSRYPTQRSGCWFPRPASLPRWTCPRRACRSRRCASGAPFLRGQSRASTGIRGLPNGAAASAPEIFGLIFSRSARRSAAQTSLRWAHARLRRSSGAAPPRCSLRQLPVARDGARTRRPLAILACASGRGGFATRGRASLGPSENRHFRSLGPVVE